MVNMPEGALYVAMGSSYAAGPFLDQRAAGSPRRAGRSSLNYAHQFAERSSLTLRDVTFSGATVAEMVRGTANGGPPQIDAVTSDTRLITITGGGNDVAYIPRLTAGSAPFPLSILPSVRSQVRAFDSPEATNAKFGRLQDDLADLIHEARRRAPGATIALVEYLPVLPSDSATDVGRFPHELAEWGRATYTRLSTLTAATANLEDCLFVQVSEAATDHHAWSADPWTRRFQLPRGNGAPYHPNRAGMSAVADLLERALSAA